ncbi:MAG TPA: PAS domain-containing sensor histidine kinase [Candidatus Melainabacteria bacterium]|nr:PAS domain-containing sensor histidine kinase [Candidatus Melainabacteria bacterium]
MQKPQTGTSYLYGTDRSNPVRNPTKIKPVAERFSNPLLKRLTVTQKGILLVLLPVVFELFFVFLVSTELTRAQSELQNILKERNIIVQLNQINVSLMRTMIQLFTPGQKDDPAALRLIDYQSRRAAEMQTKLAHLPSVSKELGEVCKQFDRILSLVAEAFQSAKEVIQDPTIPSGRRNQHLNPLLMASAFAQNRRFTQKVDLVEEQFETRVPAELAAVQNRLMTILSVGTAIGILLSMLLLRAFSKDITTRLKTISNQAQNVFQGKTLSRPQAGIDEIARLDQTLHRAAEQHRLARLREQAILHNAADVICSLDAKYRFVGVSAVAAQRWHRSENDLIGAPIASILKKDSIEATLESLKMIAKEGKGEFETRIALPQDRQAEFQWSVRWSKEERRFFCTVHDVTELRAVERLKEKFLSIVSHDLRAPITSIGISFHLLSEGKRGELPEKVASVLERAEGSLSTLTVLVNELLDLNKLEAGKMSLNTSIVSARDICIRARDSLAVLAESAGINLVATSSDCSLWADELRLTQALTNLLSNAIKFSPRGSTVGIEIELTDGKAELQVIDKGPGVPENEKAHVFDKFKQTSVKSNLKGKSSGIGLAIVKAVAQAHNGEAGVKDAPGGGSVFFLSIPRLSSSPESDA